MKFSFDSFKDFPFVHSPRLSSDAKNLVYGLTRASVEDNTYHTNLWAYNFEEARHYQLTSTKKDSIIDFLDENTLLFSSSRDENKDKKDDVKTSKIYNIDLRGGEASLFLEVNIHISKLVKLDDDNFLILGHEFDKRDPGYHEVDKLPFWLNSQGYNYDQKPGLFIYNLSEDKLDRLTGEEKDVTDFKLSPDKKSILYTHTDQDCNNLYENLCLYKLENKEENILLDNAFSYMFFDYLEDKIILVASDMKTHGLNQDSFIYSVNLDGSDLKKISSPEFDMAFYNSIGTDLRYGDGEQILVANGKLYFIVTERDHAYLKSIDLKGNLEDIVCDKKSVEFFDVSGEKLVYGAFDKMNLTELFLMANAKECQLTDFSKHLEDYEISEIEHFTFENDGNEFDGYVIKPVGYEAGKKYPGLLEIHGGPKTAYSDLIHHEMQLLASQGYFVFYTNPRGSSGRGVEFSDIRGKYGSIDYDDLMTFTDVVLEKYEDIAPERLGVLGGSYGGFMTNWVIGHTDRFKAANTQRSISNWTSFYGVSDIGYYFATDQNQASPWDNFYRLWEKSPLKHLPNAKTPTLVIHSAEDYRCPLEQGMQVFNALKVLGVDTKMMIFNGENHELSRSGKPKNRIKRLEEIVNWFNKYLNN